MKRKIHKHLLLIVLFLSASLHVQAQVPIDSLHFPDANFRAWLNQTFFMFDGELRPDVISSVKTISIFGRNISSLKGIEYFTELQTLDCHSNRLDTLDVSKNTALTYLDCSYNQLVFLDVSKNTALTHLDCSRNQLDTLDVSKNTALTYLDCSVNSLDTLDVSKNTALTTLDCGVNQLDTLDVSKNTALTTLNCGSNQLDTLDVSKNTALTRLSCHSNQLDTLDVSRHTALIYLYCQRNQLDTLDVSKNTALTTLDCSNNQLDTLDVSKNTALTTLRCSSNQFKTLDVSNNTALRDFYCGDNFLRDLDLSNNPSLLSVGFSPQYPSDEVVVVGSNRDKLAVPFPTLELNRISGLKIYNRWVSTQEKVTIGGVDHLVIASLNNADLHRTNKNYSEVYYDLMPKYHPIAEQNLSGDYYTGFQPPSMQVYLRHLPFHALYLNPASFQDGVYTGTLYLDVPTVIPTDCDLKAYSVDGITLASEAVGRLVLSQAKTGILPTASGIVVTATQPGFHLFTGDAVLDATSYKQASGSITYNTSPAAYSSNILAGTYDSEGLSVGYREVLTLGRRTDDHSGTIGFWNYKGTKLNQFRCYIPTASIPSMNSGGSSTRFMGLSLFFSDENNPVTGIETVPAGHAATTAAVYYDLQGRRVPAPKKGGVYVVGGRKVIY